MVPLPARMWSQAEPPMSGLSGNPRRDSMRSTSARRRSSPEPSGRAHSSAASRAVAGSGKRSAMRFGVANLLSRSKSWHDWRDTNRERRVNRQRRWSR